MGKKPLYVSDLDGTLLNTEGKLSGVTRSGLKKLGQHGVPFTVASGRTFSSIRSALGDAQLQLPVISSDGALISGFDSPAPLFLFGMDHELSVELTQFCQARGFHPLWDVWDGTENCLVSEGPQNAASRWFHDHKQKEVFYRWKFLPHLELKKEWKLISLTLMDEPGRLTAFRPLVEERFGPWFKTDYAQLETFGDFAALWVQSKEARKENALRVLTGMLGYPDEEVFVFGDEMNDLGMFSHLWKGVAVANARPELKERAHEVIEAHHEDSVIRFILGQNQIE